MLIVDSLMKTPSPPRHCYLIPNCNIQEVFSRELSITTRSYQRKQRTMSQVLSIHFISFSQEFWSIHRTRKCTIIKEWNFLPLLVLMVTSRIYWWHLMTCTDGTLQEQGNDNVRLMPPLVLMVISGIYWWNLMTCTDGTFCHCLF